MRSPRRSATPTRLSSRDWAQLADGYYSRAEKLCGHGRPGFADPRGGCLQPGDRCLLEGRRHPDRGAEVARRPAPPTPGPGSHRPGASAAPAAPTDTMTWAAPIRSSASCRGAVIPLTVCCMTVTYTPAAERDLRRTRRARRDVGCPMRCCARHRSSPRSAIALAYFGRIRAFDASETPGNPVGSSI